jgi:hypothetical protein
MANYPFFEWGGWGQWGQPNRYGFPIDFSRLGTSGDRASTQRTHLVLSPPTVIALGTPRSPKIHTSPQVSPPPEASAPEPMKLEASALSKLFREHGVTGQPGQITAVTVRQGETGGRRLDSVTTNEQPMSRAEAAE